MSHIEDDFKEEHSHVEKAGNRHTLSHVGVLDAAQHGVSATDERGNVLFDIDPVESRRLMRKVGSGGGDTAQCKESTQADEAAHRSTFTSSPSSQSCTSSALSTAPTSATPGWRGSSATSASRGTTITSSSPPFTSAMCSLRSPPT